MLRPLEAHARAVPCSSSQRLERLPVPWSRWRRPEGQAERKLQARALHERGYRGAPRPLSPPPRIAQICRRSLRSGLIRACTHKPRCRWLWNTAHQRKSSRGHRNVRCLYEPVVVKVVLSRGAFLALHEKRFQRALGRVGGSDVWLDVRMARVPSPRLAPSLTSDTPCIQHCGKPDRSCRI